MLARVERRCLGNQQGADRLAVRKTDHDVLFVAAGDDRMRPAACRPFGSDDLGDHATLAVLRPGTPGHRLQCRIAGTGFGHQGRLRILARIGGVQSLLVGQDDQTVSLDQIGNQGTQGIVVAKLDFVGDDGVVFIDDRHHPESKQGFQRGARVEVTLAVRKVVVRQEHLCCLQAMADKGALVDLRQLHLADRGTGLEFVHGFRAFAPAQPLHAAGNGPGRNQNDFLARLAQLGDLTCPVVDGGEIQSGTVIGHQGRTDLEDKSLGSGKTGCSHEREGRREKGKGYDTQSSSGKFGSGAVAADRGASVSSAVCNW